LTPYTFSLEASFRAKKYGTPLQGIVLSLQTDSSGVPSGTTISSSSIAPSAIPSSLDVITSTLGLRDMLGSNTRYWMVLESKNTLSATNYYAVARDSLDSHYWSGTGYSREDSSTWGTLGTDLYFGVGVPKFIYTSHPRSDLSLYGYPRVGVEITGRPRFLYRWISKSMAEEKLTCVVSVYSRYPDQLNDLVSLVNRALFVENTTLSNIEVITPGAISPEGTVRENIFRRDISFELKVRTNAT